MLLRLLLSAYCLHTNTRCRDDKEVRTSILNTNTIYYIDLIATAAAFVVRCR